MLRSQWRDRAGFTPASSHRRADCGQPIERVGAFPGADAAVSANCDFHDTPDPHPPRAVRRRPAVRPSRSTSRSTRAGSTRPARCAARLDRADVAWTSPAARARQTAEALGLDATVAPELDECDFGAWRGRTLAELDDEDPVAVAAWIEDPAAAPHGGESLLALLERVRGWLDAHAGDGARTVAVTHAGVIRAALVCALDAPAAGVLAPRRGAAVAHGAARARWAVDGAGREPAGVGGQRCERATRSRD